MTRPLVILGATGDLTGRLLLPSLGHLVQAGNPAPAVVAVSDEDLDDAGYRQWAADRLPDLDDTTRTSLTAGMIHVRGDVTAAATLRTALEHAGGEPPVIYLALPNAVFADTLEALVQAGVPAGSMIAVEKPFGSDRTDARRLNDLVHQLVPETHAFRVDHVIAKRTVLNILGLRFANRLFEPVWNNHHIERVEIVYDETLALEGRAGYYDRAGALRDMLQNHLLQILALIVMEPPRTLDSTALGAAKAEALRAVRTISPDDAVRGRYSRGRVAGDEVPAYVDEDGVDADRATETFADCTVYVDNWRWAGVPFRLRSGKALSDVRKEVCIHFQPVPHSLFTGPHPEPNILRLDLDSDAMALELDLNGDDDPFDLERRRFATDPPPPSVPAYATVLGSLLAGDSTLSITDAEAEQSWRIVEDVLARWADGSSDLREYPAGSQGPLR